MNIERQSTPHIIAQGVLALALAVTAEGVKAFQRVKLSAEDVQQVQGVFRPFFGKRERNNPLSL